MKNTPLKSVSVLAASAMLVLSGLPTMAGDGLTDATVRSYEDQLASLQQKQEQALNELDGIRSSQSEAWMEIGKYDELLNYNKEMKDLASGQLEFLETTIADTKQTLKDTTQAILAQEQAFLDRMVATYMDETTDYVELILGSESIGDFLTQMERISAILEYDRGLVSICSAPSIETIAAHFPAACALRISSALRQSTIKSEFSESSRSK